MNLRCKKCNWLNNEVQEDFICKQCKVANIPEVEEVEEVKKDKKFNTTKKEVKIK